MAKSVARTASAVTALNSLDHNVKPRKLLLHQILAHNVPVHLSKYLSFVIADLNFLLAVDLGKGYNLAQIRCVSVAALIQSG